MIRAVWLLFLQYLGFDPRGIFAFHDGRRWRHADPIELARRLWSVMITPQALPGMEGAAIPPEQFDSVASRDLIRSGIGDQMQQGYAEIANAVRQVFDVKPLNEGGLTELECATLLERFETYLGDVKKNASGSPISLPSTDSADESPTSNDSVSGSTSSDNNCEQPESSV